MKNPPAWPQEAYLPPGRILSVACPIHGVSCLGGYPCPVLGVPLCCLEVNLSGQDQWLDYHQEGPITGLPLSLWTHVNTHAYENITFRRFPYAGLNKNEFFSEQKCWHHWDLTLCIGLRATWCKSKPIRIIKFCPLQKSPIRANTYIWNLILTKDETPFRVFWFILVVTSVLREYYIVDHKSHVSSLNTLVLKRVIALRTVYSLQQCETVK